MTISEDNQDEEDEISKSKISTLMSQDFLLCLFIRMKLK